ncbi:glutaredoxin [Exophiala dermatitidis]|nr:glutaredoxin [Exophiala dermatitidis]KAJ4560144.1 glutaredoxin [Exophiala dermatitidis]
MASLTEVDSEAGFEQIIKTASPTTLFVLYFHTPWAAPCAQMNTILTTLASTYPADSDIRFLSINAEELADVSESYDVTAVPFLVLQRDGKVLETVSGSDAAKVRAVVEKYAGAGRTGTGGGIPPQLQATAPPQANGNADATKQQSSMTTATSGADVQQSQDELNERLAKLVKAAFFNILADNDVREGLKVFSDWPTFPQLYTNGELVGGLDIVREELEADPDFFKPFAAPAPSS